MPHQVAVDIGGTFMDFVAVDETGRVRIEKVPSDPDRLEERFFQGVDALGIPVADLAQVHHGTTVAVNAILQQTGARVGLITTAGFRDCLEIGRGSRREIYNLYYKHPTPLVPRRLRREAHERVNHRGEVLTALDVEQVSSEVAFLVDQGCEAIAVVLLHAYRNADHEQQIGGLIREKFPNLHCSLSHEVAPEWREYERTSTTTLDAYVAPAVERYVDALQFGLTGRGYTGPLTVMQSTGGVTAATTGRGTAIRTLESGPAGGLVAAAALARNAGLDKVIAADVGGTSFDVSLIIDGVPHEKMQTEIDRRPVLAPTLDVISLGAGGGSIAWVDEGGALQVGPESAQAFPGPACFGRGGDKPTVTDAYAALGLLNPHFFLGNRMELHLDGAREALAEHVATPLGLGVVEAADAIIRLATMNMVFAIRRITVERGHDPREFALVAYGGGGGMFAAFIAHELEISKVIIPPLPGNFSAWGILSSDFRYDDVRHLHGFLTDDLVVGAMEQLNEMEAQGRLTLSSWGHAEESDVVVNKFVDVRYFGQEHTLRVAVDADASAGSVRDAFEELHRFRYTHAYPEQPAELVTCRIVVRGIRPKPLVPLNGTPASEPLKGFREVTFPGEQEQSCALYDRESLTSPIEGPGIVEEWTSTTLLPPGDSLVVDEFGNLVIGVNL